MRRSDDVPLIAEASHDPETRRWLDDEPLTPDRQRTSVARAEEIWRSGTGAAFMVADAASDAALGLVTLKFEEERDAASVAVLVFPHARGRGVASRALRLAARWGVQELRLQRVAAEADTENTASLRAIEKAGFVREGVLRNHCATHGRRHDCVMFSLVPRDLEEARE